MGCYSTAKTMEPVLIPIADQARSSSVQSLDESDETRGSVPPSRPRKRIPGEIWETKRPIITKLYQEEKKSLKEVMEVLERDHGFKATCVLPISPPWHLSSSRSNESIQCQDVQVENMEVGA